MKNYLTPVFLLLSLVAFSQNTWNKKLPVRNYGSMRYMDANFENGRILVASSEKIVELDQLGSITGYSSLNLSASSLNFVRKRIAPNSGDPFLWLGMRGISVGQQYRMRLFVPGTGLTSEVVLTDILSSPASASPAVIVLDDSTAVSFGRQKAYKVRAQQNGILSFVWERNLTFPGTGECQAAVPTPDGFVLVSLDGSVVGLNSDGQQVFTFSHPFKFYGAAALPDGIIACGSNSDQKAVLAKLSFSGSLLWSEEYTDALFRGVAATSGGDIVATGASIDNKIALQKVNGNGQEQWRKTYQAGTGFKVIPMPDGGYFMAALSGNHFDYYGIKTSVDGTTSVADDKIFIEKRAIVSQGLIMHVSPLSSLFDLENKSLFVPADSFTTTINAFIPWISGQSTDGQLHLAAETYNTSTFQDYQAGPIGAVTQDFSKVWLATKVQINALRHDFLLNYSLDEPIPYDLLTWPARGNPHLRYNIDFTKAKTNSLLFSAPFVDFNNDGVYNVFDGDYPKIKGDQMAWWAFNDDSPANNGHGAPLKVNISMAAYLYDCPNNESVKNSFFVDYNIINRSAMEYDSTYLGFFTDFDIGCQLDDHIGSIPEANTFFGYNQTAVDAFCNGAATFGDKPPVQTITFQNKNLSYFSYFYDSFTSSPPAQREPSSPLEYYNFLRGLWRDGTPLTTGGSGYSPGSTNSATHAFPSNPSDPQGWSLCTANLITSDRRSLGSHGPFTFAPGDTFAITIAFTTHHNIPLPCPDVFGLVQPAIEQLSGWSNDGILGATPNLGVVQELIAGQSLTLGMDIPGATFQWSTGASSPTISVSAPGEYSVTVTGETGCQAVENVLVTLAAKTPPLQAPSNWSIYPNPASGFIQVACPACSKDKNLQVILRNAQGAIVRREKASGNNFPVQLLDLPSGLYWLELWESGEYLGSKKFVHISP